MTKAIYFDMDGTIADLYGFNGWLDCLHAEDVTPYEKAAPLVDMVELNKLCNQFIELGVTIGVISWSAMNGSKEYNKETRKAKKAWIEKYLPCVSEFHVVKYGTPKHQVRKIDNSVLIDDNKTVRADWIGKTIDASNSQEMLENLKMLLDMAQAA